MTARKRRHKPGPPLEASATIAAWLILFAGLFVFGRTVYLAMWSSQPALTVADAAATRSRIERESANSRTAVAPTPTRPPLLVHVTPMPEPRANVEVRDLLVGSRPSSDTVASTEARPTRRSGRSGGRIAIIIDDLGADLASAERLSQLPHRLTFAVIPHLAHSRQIANLLNGRGFEIMLHLPMEPVDYPSDDPGAGAILLRMADDEIRTTVRRDLAAIPHVRGVNNHMGSRITTSPRPMRTVLETIRETPYFFIDSRTIDSSIALDLARELKIPSAGRSVFLDSDNNLDSIRKQVRLLERVASAEGQAIAIGHPYPNTLLVLREQLGELKRRGFDLVFASELVL